MKVIALSTALCISLAAAPYAFAGPRDGAQEIQGAASYIRPLGTGSVGLVADVSYGYFLNPMLEVGIRQGYVLAHNDDAPDVWNAVTTPFLDVHFADWIPDQRFVPFLGGFVGGVWNDDDGTGVLGPEGGIKLHLSDDAFIAARYRYEWFFDELDSPDTQQSNHVGLIALGYQWGGAGDSDMRRGR